MTDALPVGERKQLAPPIDESGPLGWVRKNLFSSWGNAITTVVLIAAIGVIALPTGIFAGAMSEVMQRKRDRQDDA